MTLNNVPLGSQTLSITQPLIQNNFQTIDTAFAVDHVPYTLSGQGKHNKVTFPVQPSAPSFGSTEAGLYNLLDSFSGANQLFVQPPGGGSAYPMTASNLSVGGYSYLPAGLIIQWGSSTMTGTTANVVFTSVTGKSFPNALFSVVATTKTFSGTNTPINITSPATTGFTASSNTSGMSFYWIALGY